MMFYAARVTFTTSMIVLSTFASLYELVIDFVHPWIRVIKKIVNCRWFRIIMGVAAMVVVLCALVIVGIVLRRRHGQR